MFTRVLHFSRFILGFNDVILLIVGDVFVNSEMSMVSSSKVLIGVGCVYL